MHQVNAVVDCTGPREEETLSDSLKSLLQHLRKLEKAYGQMLQNSRPRARNPEQNADAALNSVLALLEDPVLAALIASQISQVRDQVNTIQFDNDLKTRRDDVTHVEMRLSQPFGLKERDLELMYEQYSKAKDEKKEFVTDVSAIRDHLTKAHKAIKEQVASSKKLPRKKKKLRKQNIGQGVVSAVFGVAVIASNTQLPMVFHFSFGLGGAALHQSIRDIVGTAS